MTLSDLDEKLVSLSVRDLHIRCISGSWQATAENGVIACGSTVEQCVNRFIEASEGQKRWNTRMREKLEKR